MASLDPTHSILGGTPSRDTHRCLQTTSGVPWGQDLLSRLLPCSNHSNDARSSCSDLCPAPRVCSEQGRMRSPVRRL